MWLRQLSRLRTPCFANGLQAVQYWLCAQWFCVDESCFTWMWALLCCGFLQRYEQKLLPSTVGALAVTTYCVARGQEPATAAVITVVATVTALVSPAVPGCSVLFMYAAGQYMV